MVVDCIDLHVRQETQLIFFDTQQQLAKSTVTQLHLTTVVRTSVLSPVSITRQHELTARQLGIGRYGIVGFNVPINTL